MAACDSVTVMRDGVSVQTVAITATTPEALAAAIVGEADVHVDVAPETRLDGAGQPPHGARHPARCPSGDVAR